MTFWARARWLILTGLLALVLAAGGAVVPSSVLAYDAPTVSRADAHRFNGVDAEEAKLSAAGKESAWWSPEPPGTSTTPSGAVVATNTVRYGPSNPGPLLDDVASTFRSGSYTGEVLQSETMLYRVYGGESGPIGSYWSRTAPSGPMQAQIDSALNPAWGNTATNVATIRVPAGTTIYDGVAAAQSLPGGGTLLGGGSQVYIPKVNPDWLVP